MRHNLRSRPLPIAIFRLCSLYQPQGIISLPWLIWGKSSVTGHKIVGQKSDETFAWRVDDAAGDDSGGVAAEPHAHGEDLFAGGAAFLECTV